jgi:hypothetical protein
MGTDLPSPFAIDFLEMKEIRKFTQNWRKKYIRRYDKQKRFGLSTYKRVEQYVGTKTVYIRIVEPNMPTAGISKLAEALALEFDEFEVYYSNTDIHIYIRGYPRT